MATHQIGKFKFRFSKGGFQYKWGDGEVKSIGFGMKKAEADDDYGRYQGDDSDYAYDENEGYYQEGQEGYDDGYYYDGPQSEDGDIYYDEVNADEPQAGPVMEYIENNLWVLIALLVVLPPLGIYLLWRFNRFEFNPRVIISAASAVWFIVALILIFSGIFSGGEDTSKVPEMTLTSMRPTVTPTIAPVATPVATPDADDPFGANATPSATPLAGATNTGSSGGSNTADSGNVYSPQSGLYYHKVQNCSKVDANVSLTLVTVEAAKNRRQSPCPLCFGGTVYYATANGGRYHTDRTCDGMQNAVEYSKEAAEREGKVACHICAGGKDPSSSGSSGTTAQQYTQTIKRDKSGLKVWMTTGGSAFHATANCRGMSGAAEVTLLKALQSGKPACETCLNYLNTYVYATAGGTYYHSKATTCGMKEGTRVTLAYALVLGKKKCPDCIDSSMYTNKEEDKTTGSSSELMVYATETGSYYHTDSSCGGMKNASRVPLKKALEVGRPACPVCCPSAEKTVYAASGNKYYHSYAACGGMKNAVSGTLAKALSLGLTACPDCWNGNGQPNEEAEDGNSGYSGIFVYATETGKHYHASKNCTDIEEGYSRVLLEQAIDDGKTPCSVCASYASMKVYGAEGNKYFHKTSTCSGIIGAKSGTVADALLLGLEVCPICFDEDDLPKESVNENKYVNGKSGIKVYATTEGRYYHMNTLCSRISGNPVKVSLETALNYDKKACPVCASNADRTVYGNSDGKYYHYSSSCAGDSAVSGHLDTALALGLKGCPNCVTNKDENEEGEKPGFDEFISGTSGFEVYAVATQKYYHTNSTCGGMTGASKITLEKALNMGFEACPDCAALGSRIVYGKEGSKVYHADKSCAGSNAISGRLDKALAYGYQACPICIGGQGENGEGGLGDTDPEDNPFLDDNSTENNGGSGSSAPAGSHVYVDLSGNSSAFLYHKDKKCAESGMTNGTAVTLEYALDSGFSDCGYCNPPTSIEEVE